MSGLINKASVHEEKGKWKNAAETYLKAAEEFKEQGDKTEAKKAILNAITNAEKANINELLIESILALTEYADKNDKKDILPKAIPALDELITENQEKKKYQDMIELLEQKEQIMRKAGLNLEEVLLNKGSILQIYALDNVTSRKESDREEAYDNLELATKAFLEIDKKVEKVNGEIKILDHLLESGFLDNALKLFDDLLDFCSKYKLPDATADVIQVFINKSKEVITGSASKKLVKALKERFDDKDLNGEFLAIITSKALNVKAYEILLKALDVQTDYADTLFKKKNYKEALIFYDKALEIAISIEHKEEATKIAQHIETQGYKLLKDKTQMQTSFEYFNSIIQIGKINLDYLGNFYQSKAENMFSYNQIKAALDDYKNAMNTFKQCKLTQKITETAENGFDKALTLIKAKDYFNGLAYTNEITIILEEIESYEQIGKNLTQIAVAFIDEKKMTEANELSMKAVESLLKAENNVSAASTHQQIGEALLKADNYDTAAFHLLESAKLFKNANALDKIDATAEALITTAFDKLNNSESKLAQTLMMNASLCLEQKDPVTQAKKVSEFADHAIAINFPNLAFKNYQFATNVLGKNYPDEVMAIIDKVIINARQLIISTHNFDIGKEFIDHGILTLKNLDENLKSADLIIEFGNLFFDNKQPEYAMEILLLIPDIISFEKYPTEYGEKIEAISKILIENSFVEQGIEFLQKAIKSYINISKLEPVQDIITYTTKKAVEILQSGNKIDAKHLYIVALNTSILAKIDEYEKVLTSATNAFLNLNDLYTVRELYDIAKNSLQNETEYLDKLARLIISQGDILRDDKEMIDESIDFIKNGINVLRQINQLEVAGEISLTQGKAFIEKDHFIYGEELIEIGAQIFIELNDINRAGDAFLSIAEVHIQRELWEDSYRQIDLAIKSFLDAKNHEKLHIALTRAAEIGLNALANQEEFREFALEIFDNTAKIAKQEQLIATEIDIKNIEAKAFAAIKDYQTAYNVFLEVTNILEQKDEKEKSPIIADTIAQYSQIFIASNEIQMGIHLVDLATGIFLRLGQPINASEVYIKACNSLLKMNQIGESVKLALLASDTLMVANEYEHAVSNLEDISKLLFDLKDYENASIVVGQIVTIHQKTGKIKEQKEAIYNLVEKAKEVINKGKIMEGEQLWDQISSYSISVNIDFAMEINTVRIDNLIAAGMYNSVNNAYRQILTILETNPDELLILAERIFANMQELFEKNEFELTKNFTLTAVEYYKKANAHEKAKDLCIDMSHRFINSGEETIGIELLDLAAQIANEFFGAHEAAKLYLISGFVLIEKGSNESGSLAVNKAIDIELQTNNLAGCSELAELTMQRANDVANSDIQKAIDIYQQASSIFNKANNFTKAGETKKIISSNLLGLGKIKEAVITFEEAIDFYISGQNFDLAEEATKSIIEAARNLFDENRINEAVHILERCRFIVEKISKFNLLTLIIDIYVNGAKINLPNRKSAIGIYFLKRAFEMAKTSPNPEEIKRLVTITLDLALEIIKNKNSLAGAKVIEIASKQDISITAMIPQVTACYIEALKLTLSVEWNMIGKITRDALKFFKLVKANDGMKQILSILVKRANADILNNKPQLGFFFIDHALRLARDINENELLLEIGSELYTQTLVIEADKNFEMKYRLLGYCNQIFQEIQNMEFIRNVGIEFVKLGSKDLIENMQSIRGYEAILTGRDLSVQTQDENLMGTIVLALLDFALQFASINPMTTLAALDDIIEGLTAFEVPNSNRASIELDTIWDYIKKLINAGEKLAKKDTDYTTGQKIIENCMRIQVLSNNTELIEKELEDIKKNLQKLYRRGNIDSAYKLKHGAILLIDIHNTNGAIQIGENSFQMAQQLFERKKYDESIYYLETALKINGLLNISSELKNIGLFAISSGDRLVNEGKIKESMIYYDIAVEAFDEANDDENSNRLVNRIFQTREWDADISIGYRVYKIASESAIRINNKEKALDIANKCFNRGTAFIDQPRIPTGMSLRFISLAGRIFEDIGAIKDAANAYDNAILKYIRLMKSRKNIEPIIIELLTKTAVNRMASCDMDSLETIYLRIMELAEMKKSKYTKTFAKILKYINSSKVGEAWDLIASLPFYSHGRIRRIVNTTKSRIIISLQQKGTFDRTILSTTDRSLPLSDYLIQNLLISRKIEGQPINKDVFISSEKIKAIRKYFYSEYELWGRIDVANITQEFKIHPNDVASIIRREFISTLYMGILDNSQKTFFSFERLKAEISLIVNRERKKQTQFNPMQVASEMQIPPDIIKEVLREIACEEVVEKAIGS